MYAAGSAIRSMYVRGVNGGQECLEGKMAGHKKYCAKCGDHISAKTNGEITRSFGIQKKSARWKWLDSKCMDEIKGSLQSGLTAWEDFLLRQYETPALNHSANQRNRTETTT